MVPAYAPELLPLLQQPSGPAAAVGAGAGPLPAKKKKAVPGPAAASGQQQPGALPPLTQLVRALLGAEAAGALLDDGLRPPLRLAVKFRVSKKMLLADVVLAARVPLEQLEQLQQQQAAPVDSACGGDDGGALPWQQLADAS